MYSIISIGCNPSHSICRTEEDVHSVAIVHKEPQGTVDKVWPLAIFSICLFLKYNVCCFI